MNIEHGSRLSIRRVLGRIVLVAGALALGGCATAYVDGSQPEVPKANFVKPTNPKATQLVFEFQTRGTPNARATDALKERVRTQVAESGLFSSISEAPVAGGALLTITVNNVPLTDNATAKGFMTGLTFGLAGSTVGDGYEGVLRYTSGPNAQLLSTQQARHALWTSLGTGSAPPGATKAASINEGVTIMLRQLISRLLSDLSQTPGFAKAGDGDLSLK